MISAIILLFSLIKGKDKVEKYIKAITIWTLFCFSLTEILSLFHGISTRNLWICWIIFDMILMVLNYFKYRNKKWRDMRFPRKSIARKQIVAGLFFIGMIALALKTIPYNWDSMTYHLPRIFHWFQNGTVEHYATHIDRQVASPVLGAFVNLNVYAMMGGNDIFVNLLQCCSFLSNGVLVYYIAKKICCSDKYCMAAAVLFYTMPIAFAEAVTTQVDNYSTLWMLCFVYLILDFLNPKEKIVFNKSTSFYIIILSMCIAFGYLTKPSVGIGMVFFALWLLLVVIKRKDNFITLVAYALLAIGILLILLTPEFLRNLETYNALASSATGKRQLIGSLHPKHILVNAIKNFTFNMPTIWIYNSSEIIYKCVMRFAGFLEIDINNPGISEDGRAFEVRTAQNYGHDNAVNPIMVWLVIGCAICLLLKNRKKGLAEVKNQYFIVACMSFFVFCTMLRWEPFVSRYMISYFAVLCPAIAGQLDLLFENNDECSHKNEIRLTSVLYFLCITEIMGVIYYHGRIALNQSKQVGYFENRSNVTSEYVELIELVNRMNYRNIGLLIGEDSYEYPLEAMLNYDTRIEHINVTNVTGKYEDIDFIPDIVVAINYGIEDSILSCHGHEYELNKKLGENVCVLKQIEN